MSDAISDGYGETETTDEIIARVESWAKHYAAGMVSRDDAFYDELVQEARIEVWKTLEKNKNVNASYLITAMRWRMLSMIRAHAKVQKRTLSLDYEDLDPALLTSPETLDGVVWAYHHGEMMEVLNDLDPRHQEYVIRRFWHGQRDAQIARDMGVYPSQMNRWWNNFIKPKLEEKFEHLEYSSTH